MLASTRLIWDYDGMGYVEKGFLDVQVVFLVRATGFRKTVQCVITVFLQDLCRFQIKTIRLEFKVHSSHTSCGACTYNCIHACI